MQDTPFKVSLYMCRANKRLTQKQLGDMIGVSDQTIKNWESGKTHPNTEKLKAISKVCGVPIEFIDI